MKAIFFQEKINFLAVDYDELHSQYRLDKTYKFLVKRSKNCQKTLINFKKTCMVIQHHKYLKIDAIYLYAVKLKKLENVPITDAKKLFITISKKIIKFFLNKGFFEIRDGNKFNPSDHLGEKLYFIGKPNIEYTNSVVNNIFGNNKTSKRKRIKAVYDPLIYQLIKTINKDVSKFNSFYIKFNNRHFIDFNYVKELYKKDYMNVLKLLLNSDLTEQKKVLNTNFFDDDYVLIQINDNFLKLLNLI